MIDTPEIRVYIRGRFFRRVQSVGTCVRHTSLYVCLRNEPYSLTQRTTMRTTFLNRLFNRLIDVNPLTSIRVEAPILTAVDKIHV